MRKFKEIRKMFYYFCVMFMVALIGCTPSEPAAASNTPAATNSAPKAGIIAVGTPTADAISISWTAATDDTTVAKDLSYKPVITTDILKIKTAVDADKLTGSYAKAIVSKNFDDLAADTTYYITVLVKDTQGLITMYESKTIKTAIANSKSSEAKITAFTLSGENGVINETAETIAVTVPFGTVVTDLAATFGNSAGSTVKVGATAQVSGTTKNNFTSAVSYVVTAEDGITTKTYIVTVTIAPKANTAPIVGIITAGTPTASAISISWTAASDDTTLASDLLYKAVISTDSAKFASDASADTLTGSYAKGVASKEFTGLAADTTYYMTVLVKDEAGLITMYEKATAKTATAGSKSSAADISAFTLSSVAGSITGTAIAVTVPFGTAVNDLAATFGNSAGSTVKVGATAQVSGTTKNNFTSAVSYVVTAEDGITTKTYIVTVTIAAASTDATLKSLTFSALTLKETFASGTTAYTADAGTTTTATPTVNHAGATVKVNAVSVTSGTASASIDVSATCTISIVVTAENGTTKTYTVTVTKTASIKVYFRSSNWGFTPADKASFKVCVGGTDYAMTKAEAGINYWAEADGNEAWYVAEVPGETDVELSFFLKYNQGVQAWAVYDSTSVADPLTKVEIKATPTNGKVWVDRHNWYADGTGTPKLAKVIGSVTVGATAPNDAPKASVTVTGTGKVGTTLTAGCTYSDSEKDAQDGTTTYKWKISDTLEGVYADISGETNSTLALVVGYNNKYIKAEASVKALSGTTTATTGLSVAKKVTNTEYPDITIDGTEDADWTNAALVKSFTDSDAGLGWAKNFDSLKVTNTATDLILQIKLKDGADSGAQLKSLQVYIDSDSNATTGKTDFRTASTLFGDGAGNLDGYNVDFTSFGADLALRFGWADAEYYAVKFPDATGAATTGSAIYFNNSGDKNYAEIKIPFTELTSIITGSSSIKLLFVHANTWGGAEHKGQIIDCYPKATSGASADGSDFTADNFITYSIR